MFRHSATKLFSPLQRRIFPSSSSFCSQANAAAGISPTGITSIVKPSSPTPRHLAEFKLSFIDNYIPPVYGSFVFFYPGGEGAVGVLKSSLADALTRFYPLAGRLSSSAGADSIPIIRCNDEGVPFTTAASSLTMTRFLSSPPEIDSLHHFLPFRPFLIEAPSEVESAPQLAVKATVFPCGGIAVGVCMLHKIGDGHTFFSFMRLWAAFARGDDGGGGAYAHDQAATSLFPARHDDVLPSALDYIYEEEEKRSVTKRFVFDGEAVARLKLRARSEWVPNPTRFEAISGLVWKSAVNATAKALALAPDGDEGESVYSVAGMAMDLRRRMVKPWGDYAVGNVLWTLTSLYDKYQEEPREDSISTSDETKTLQQVVRSLRSSITQVDKTFMQKLEGGAGREEYSRNEEARSRIMAARATRSGSKVLFFVMSSTFGMDVYGVDFGWGKPVWVSLTRFPNKMNNALALLNSPDGSGAEAWIVMHDHEMSILEEDPEILAYAKINPNVLPP